MANNDTNANSDTASDSDSSEPSGEWRREALREALTRLKNVRSLENITTLHIRFKVKGKKT